MEYPHRRYLLYLLSRRMTVFEVMSECTAKSLMAPNDESLKAMIQSLGTFPTFWRSDLKRANTSFRRWLRDVGVLGMWSKGQAMSESLDLLYRADVRKDYEALMLMQGDVSQARKDLLDKYPKNYIPSAEGLQAYSDFFWDLGSMSHEGIYLFLKANQERQEFLPALQGDLATTYGMLGLRQRVEAIELYDNIIALANQQVQVLRKAGGGSASKILAVAALTKQAGDALQAREELNLGGRGNDIRDQAAQFKMRRVSADPIPSIEDLMREEEEDVIDAEFSNVRKLPVA